MDSMTISLLPESRNDEDYTDSVCWAFWLPKLGRYDTREALVDLEDYARLQYIRWSIQRIGKCKHLRVVGGSNTYLARFIVECPLGKVVDHHDRNTLNDRRSNLRICSQRENNLNRPGVLNTSSKFKGVAWSKSDGKWKVITGTKAAKVYLGSFDDEAEAAKVYNDFAKVHFGPFAYLNPV